MTKPLVAYAYVSPEDPPPQCQIHEVSSAVEKYLLQHVEVLLRRGENGVSAPAKFRDTAARKRFDQLSTTQSQPSFLATAQELAIRLHEQMDGRTKAGFFVALRRELPGKSPQVAVLKLDILDKAAAAARREPSGQFRLEAIEDLLDLPGDLHKGAVYPDPRRGSDVVVGDEVAVETALYFLRALEVRQTAKAAAAGKLFLQVVEETAPAKLGPVAQALGTADGELTPKELFDAHPGLLTDHEKSEILDALDTEARPVVTLNPGARRIRKIVTADDIVIRGAVADMEAKVDWESTPSGWRITIDVQQQPQVRYE